MNKIFSKNLIIKNNQNLDSEDFKIEIDSTVIDKQKNKDKEENKTKKEKEDSKKEKEDNKKKIESEVDNLLM